MALHSRNLLFFLMLSGIAVLTWMLAREPEEPAAAGGEYEPAPQGYYLLNAELQGTGADGRINYRIFAERVEQLAEGENFELNGMRVEYTPESNIRWRLTAENGYMPKDRSNFELRDVRLIHTANEADSAATFEASTLTLDPEKSLAGSSEAVIFRSGKTEIHATGMAIDLEAETYTLEPNVTIRSQP